MKKYSGFTLIELMTCVAIVAILLAVAIPGMTHLINRSNADSHAHTILRLLSKTRETALLSGKRTTLCGLDPNNQCVPDNITELIIFHDHNRNQRLNDEEQPIQHVDLKYTGSINLRAANGGPKAVTYLPDGSVNRQGGSYVLCHNSGDVEYARRVVVSPSGRIYIEKIETEGAKAYLAGRCNGIVGATY